MPRKLSKPYVQSIIENPNLVIRNLQVTQGYYRLSRGLKRMMSGSNISWCTFAAHASKTAGQALRHELMPRFLRSLMIRQAGYDNTFVFFTEGLQETAEPLTEVNQSRVGEALRRMSELVSDGNITVFEELVWPFAAFVDRFGKDWAFDEAKLRDFQDEHLQPGPLNEGGQDYLREAFTAYYQARFATHPKEKAEQILRGNLLVGLHEQTRLQPQIEQAMAVPVELFSTYNRDETGKMTLDRQSLLARRLVSRAITQMMMLITLPSRQLKLSQDVVAPTGIRSFPEDLLLIEDPRCLELVRMFESDQDTLSGSGASNWASLQNRMRFVVDFFRSHQQYRRMWESPFLPEQAAVIETGHFPAGPL